MAVGRGTHVCVTVGKRLEHFGSQTIFFINSHGAMADRGFLVPGLKLLAVHSSAGFGCQSVVKPLLAVAKTGTEGREKKEAAAPCR